ncbi:CLPTM1-like membrane protein cnrB [Galdieria sulphuraria]|uniref:Cleft lip and palate transmembrane protein 1-like protein n=1 Tax=Galdieria sulphuraria TaxID=130081 RepID=M2VZI5_GALSU|nr:uncharacterized protein Gasu_38000 [Galdieria sulphuraria]EME28751.1 hypothetical protein Gasu_38000 [Galdieria sulphuraria]GJD07096.1 CLPTM1-like membrane protein cnrB [Galdieria sulphuraria]|eukprot:XP_005705271.1 hypothetical protein Gasu_38000 [Galdieria sulphuraria]
MAGMPPREMRPAAVTPEVERTENKRQMLADIIFFGFLLSLLYVTSSKSPDNSKAQKPLASSGERNLTSSAIYQPRWKEGQPFLLQLYVSPLEVISPEVEKPVWTELFTYDFNKTNERHTILDINLDYSILRQNQALFCYAVAKKLVPEGSLGDLVVDKEEPFLMSRTNLVVVKDVKPTVAKALIKKGEDLYQPTSDNSSGIYFKPFTSISIIVDFTPYDVDKIPPLISEHIQLLNDSKQYLPLFTFEEFWLLSSNLVPLNDSVRNVSVKVSFRPLSLMKWTIFTQLDSSWKTQNGLGLNTAEETDELKRMFLETNPYFLSLTGVVTVLHTIFEFLAFKNDVTHWRDRKSIEGISVRSMMWKLGMEVVILLYLLDNETSWMIIMSSFLGLALEAWKLSKAFRFKDFGKVKLFGIIPFFRVRNRKSYSKNTKELDDQAMKYMSFIIYPLVAGYSIYSLFYETHKSWYSWILSSLVGAVYAFGFIMMLPQIFINYKLKSVAHLPMKAMMYKFLNTIIDDLFAFIIKMPTLHRLACFRDDIVFLIFLYQRWIYPVDKSRVNEFGQEFTNEEEEKKKKQ